VSIGLRPYQSAAIEAFEASPKQRKLIVFPTGAGKTITGLSLAKARGGKCLWLAHRDELITQPAQALRLVWPEVTSGIVKADLNQYMRHVVFASIQSAQQPRRLEQLSAQGFELVVVDEAHRALADGYLALFEALGCARDDGPRLLGITATPERADNAPLSDVFEEIVYNYGITTAIADGYLIAPTIIERKIAIDLDSVTVSRGDFAMKQLDVALMQAGIVREVVDAHREHCALRKTIVFTVSVAQAEAIAAEFRNNGVAAAAVSGETPTEERRRILRQLASGAITTVVNCAVLTEGFDEPSVDCVILARPTQSKGLTIQCVGRALRLHPGKSDALVIDMVGVSQRHTLIQAAVLFGVRQEPEERAASSRAAVDPEEFWRQRLSTQIEGIAGAPRSALRWVPSESGAWLMDAGIFGTVRMVPQGEHWIVDTIGVRVVGSPKHQKLSDRPVSQDIAQALAEDYVRRVNAVNKANANAAWRDRAASEKDVKFLRRAGVDAKEGITAGTAADLALQVKEQHALKPATPAQLKYLRDVGIKIPAACTKREAQGLIVKSKFRKSVHQ
jgi:superfamily II DNA or RNA helicase